jgi:hypothetical protein
MLRGMESCYAGGATEEGAQMDTGTIVAFVATLVIAALLLMLAAIVPRKE